MQVEKGEEGSRAKELPQPKKGMGRVNGGDKKKRGNTPRKASLWATNTKR